MKVFLETYGCQMNFADSEIVGSVLTKEGYEIVSAIDQADYVLINTCAIRDNAEQRIRKRLRELRAVQSKHPNLRVGILGCMAERLQQHLLEEEENVCFVVGPDSYRKLPHILKQVSMGIRTTEVELSSDETYSDIIPIRYNGNGISAYISIMRGCQNFCSYCVVPYTRGRERSRSPQTILEETESLVKMGYKEVTLLGQNVNSYKSDNVGFPELISMVAEVDPKLRVRFATSHPKDLSDDLLKAMASHNNICRCIHLPVQSGSDRMLKLMNRRYSSEWYLNRIEAIRSYMPDCSITTDIITGFCGETEEDHRATLEMFRKVRYDYAYMFKYSMRPNTYAEKHLVDDVPDNVKTKRLEEVIALQGEIALENNKMEIGKEYEVLVEGTSHRSKDQLYGRNSQNKVIVFDRHDFCPGDYVKVKVTDCTAATLKGVVCKRD